MFKFVILFAVIAAAAAGLAPAFPTPLLGRSLTLTKAEHVVGGLKPIANQYLSLPDTFSAHAPTVYSAGHVPVPFGGSYGTLAPTVNSAGHVPVPFGGSYGAYVAPITY